MRCKKFLYAFSLRKAAGSKKSIINHRTHFHHQSVTVVTVVTVFSAYPHLPLFRGNL